MITSKEIFDAKAKWDHVDDQFAIAAGEILGLPIEKWPFEAWRFDSYDDSFEFDGCLNEFRVTLDQCVAFAAMGFDRFWLNHKDGSETRYYRVRGEWGFDRPSQVNPYNWEPLATTTSPTP